MNGTLIYCEKCIKEGKKNVLGRLLEKGEFHVLRFQHGTTIVTSGSFTVQCPCGYTVDVNKGSIKFPTT